MKVSALAVLASATFASVAMADDIQLTYNYTEALGGRCIDQSGYVQYLLSPPALATEDTINGAAYDFWLQEHSDLAMFTHESCFAACMTFPVGLIGFSLGINNNIHCGCHYHSDENGVPTHPACDEVQALFPAATCNYDYTGTGGDIVGSPGSIDDYQCFLVTRQGESHGDPHFRTWQDEHFEFHGQCDVLMTKVKDFAEQPGLDLEIQIRTKMVRFWSYIKNAVIRIGDDVLEIQGSASEDLDTEIHYWYNYEYQGEMTEFAGFPVTMSSEGTKANKNTVEIDLGSKYPGQKIILKTFKEFVGVKIVGATEESFGSAIGIMGDFKSGKTVARDGFTVIDDFNKLGQEWQVLPTDGKLFREMSHPQFPEKCLIPEDPQGQRIRRLGEANVSEEAAEAACAGLKDEFDRKGCVYDILATQDLEMAGAY